MIADNPIWRIKYLPSALNDICGRENIIERLKEVIKKKNFPHILFVGAEGIGKTTIAKLFSKEFLGKEFDANFKLVYADVPLDEEERTTAKSEAYVSTSKIGSTAGKSITTPAFIQVKVKPFVQLKALGGAPFKILIVKNFDALGSNQQGFRRLMEIYGSNCRMIFITTKISRVIDPIVSRCQLFLVSQVNFEPFKKLIEEIAVNEKLEIEEDSVEILYKITEGKLHKAIDLLQLSSVSGNNIDAEKLFELVKDFKDDQIKGLMEICFKGKFKEARNAGREIIKNYKYNSQELFSLILEELLKLPISKYTCIKIIEMIADADFRAVDGQNSDIQISSLLANLCLFSEKM